MGVLSLELTEEEEDGEAKVRLRSLRRNSQAALPILALLGAEDFSAEAHYTPKTVPVAEAFWVPV